MFNLVGYLVFAFIIWLNDGLSLFAISDCKFLKYILKKTLGIHFCSLSILKIHFLLIYILIIIKPFSFLVLYKKIIKLIICIWDLILIERMLTFIELVDIFASTWYCKTSIIILYNDTIKCISISKKRILTFKIYVF